MLLQNLHPWATKTCITVDSKARIHSPVAMLHMLLSQSQSQLGS
jgi:hypothetical protein